MTGPYAGLLAWHPGVDPCGHEAEIARLRKIEEAARCHGGCLCEYYPGYPRGSRHAPECDNDPDLRAAQEAK